MSPIREPDAYLLMPRLNSFTYGYMQTLGLSNGLSLLTDPN